MTDRSDQLAALRALVERHEVLDHIESEHRGTVLAAIDRHGEAVARRDCRPGHLTGSAMVVDTARRRLVLLHHRKLDIWVQPGGHADGELDLGAVALREATEETGIPGLRLEPSLLDIDVHEVRPPTEDAHLHLDLRFLVVAPDDAALALNDESRAGRWVGPDAARSLNDEAGLRRLVVKAFD